MVVIGPLIKELPVANAFIAKFPAKSYNAQGEHVGPGPWLSLVHAANGVEDGFFGSPDSTGDWWAGGYVEEYEHARIVHSPDESVTVASKTDHGTAVLELAERGLSQ